MSLLRRRRDLLCQQLVELVTAYLEGDLDAADRAAVEDHLAECGACNGYVAQVRRMLELTAAEEPEPVPEDLVASLTAAFRARRR